MRPSKRLRSDLFAYPFGAQFERDEIEEEELFRIFFADGRPVDGAALKQHMVCAVVQPMGVVGCC